MSLEVVHRFENAAIERDGGLYWDLSGLVDETLAGLRRAGGVRGVGVDAWGCDYGLLDRRGRLLRPPRTYRDQRVAAYVQRAYEAVSKRELYKRTGTQHLRFNTIFQLLADAAANVPLERAERLAMIPDLIAYRLGGQLVNEVTAASTTGLVTAASRTWAVDLVERLGLPLRPFAHDLVKPGTSLGTVRALKGGPLLRAVAGHDTASAFAAAPVTDGRSAVISCGTWSLVGLELDRPRLGTDAESANLGNEAGIDGTTRLLRNVMGLWLLQECRREWGRRVAVSESELEFAAAVVRDEDVPLFDPDLEIFLEPGDMSTRIADVCIESGQRAPASPPEVTRSILLSLACKYRAVLELLERINGRGVDIVHLVGGGVQNKLLCRLAADVTGRPIVAGPVEASAIGNLLIQARADGVFSSREEMRGCVSRSFPPEVYQPGREPDAYERFLTVTRLREGVVAARAGNL